MEENFRELDFSRLVEKKDGSSERFIRLLKEEMGGEVDEESLREKTEKTKEDLIDIIDRKKRELFLAKKETF